MDAAYSLTNVGDIIFLHPWPGTPGKWFWLYLKSALSKAIQERRAACSAAVVMLYCAKEEMRGSTAEEAVAHSAAMGALAHEAEVGAMEISCATGSDWRGERCGGGEGGEENAEVMNRIARVVRVARGIAWKYLLRRVKIRRGRASSGLWDENIRYSICVSGFASGFLLVSRVTQ